MRTTVSIDDELYAQALEVADPGTDKADIFRQAMKTLCGCSPPSAWRPWAVRRPPWPT